jgi:hypothetical protein
MTSTPSVSFHDRTTESKGRHIHVHIHAVVQKVQNNLYQYTNMHMPYTRSFTTVDCLQNRIRESQDATWIMLDKQTVKLLLCLIHHALRNEIVWLSGDIAPPFLTSALDGGEWSALRHGRFYLAETSPGICWIGGRVLSYPGSCGRYGHQ